MVDAEWNILYDKLDRIAKSGAKVVLSKLPIGDVATQVGDFVPVCDNFSKMYQRYNASIRVLVVSAGTMYYVVP